MPPHRTSQPSGGSVSARALPIRVTAPPDGADLAGWAGDHRAEIDEYLRTSGAVLFRGFGVTQADQFEPAARSLCAGLMRDTGEHPRDQVGGSVFSPVFYAPEQKLLWHNEQSFDRTGPARILFCCAEPAEQGGETPIVDSRLVLAALPGHIREPFSAQGVQYRRAYHPGVGRSWQQVFGTEDRVRAEELCRIGGIEFSWHGKVLTTQCTRPAILEHPITKERSWFNQAQHWHPSCLDPATRSSLATVFGPDLPRDCRLGDGSVIPDAWMTAILEVYASLESVFPWQAGDVLALDNILVAHARNPYRGKRRLLVAMGDETTFDGAAPSN
ncbi:MULTISPECIES: TauD/TfdA family dioxygenase [Amycolatopsis]|uniref:TauD/TfdA family dioxygenase n=1 Tax=Amycolatopsis albidoflavus TaxID=102226 RepID=A0ABW5HYI4_9PSEU